MVTRHMGYTPLGVVDKHPYSQPQLLILFVCNNAVSFNITGAYNKGVGTCGYYTPPYYTHARHHRKTTKGGRLACPSPRSRYPLHLHPISSRVFRFPPCQAGVRSSVCARDGVGKVGHTHTRKHGVSVTVCQPHRARVRVWRVHVWRVHVWRVHMRVWWWGEEGQGGTFKEHWHAPLSTSKM